MKRLIPVPICLALALATLLSARPAASAVQTQPAMSGDMEVDVLKADVKDDILTVALAYRNTGAQAATVGYRLDDVYFVDPSEKKKYQVLKDSKGEWLGAPVARGAIGTDTGSQANPLSVPAKGKAAVWFKFPAPPESTTKINLVIPDVLPFEDLPITR